MYSNYPHPLQDIVEGETDHYKVKKIVNSQPTPNHHSIWYLVKWKDYSESENTWIPAFGMKHIFDLVKQLYNQHSNALKPPIWSLQVQWPMWPSIP
jgi:hypothetical protein